MKSFWTWVQSLFTFNNETSKEFNTKGFLYRAEEARIEAMIKHHRPGYSKNDRAA